MKHLFLLGPILFLIVVISLTIIQYDFLLGLGWDPINRPTLDWPSGLALGRYGIVMTATFIISGLIMFLFGIRLDYQLEPARSSQTGSILLAYSGLALAGLAFITDPTLRNTPATWHGILHDASFVMLGLTLFTAMIVLGFAFRNDPRWNDLSAYTWITVLLAIPAYVFKGAAFYIFLLAILAWEEIIAMRLIILDKVGRNKNI